MKLDFSVTKCFGVIFCVCVVAAATDNDDNGGLSGRGTEKDIHDCTGQRLKSKGILASDVDIGTSSTTMCRVLLGRIIPATREEFETKAKVKLPNEVVCVMTEFDKGEIIDFLLKVAFYQTHESLSAAEKETLSAGFKTEADKLRDTTAAACGIEVNKFQSFLDTLFEPRSSTVTASETA